ncbi:MAG: 30S ribosomal protein S6 [Bacteroidetes bacterium]|nr:30S ribosomal protein S6 [Bacteroidia bacterium]PCH67973.1 MAG: 30S ribosomal protein S6 [Bacteroidota bacterium]
MTQYETIFIINPVLSGDETKKLIAKFKGLLKKEKAEIIHEEDWGLRQLAYEIKGKGNGYYYLIEYKAGNEVVKNLEVEFGRDENIFRHLTVSLDKNAIAFNVKQRGGAKATKKDEPVLEEAK